MQILPSSFRDNSGFVFKENEVFYRTVLKNYEPSYNKLMQSGLYEKLISKQLFIPHEEIENEKINNDVIKILKPAQLNFISYAWEWSFSMLKDAALCTLENAIIAINFGMILKDANTHNIQFVNGKATLVDSLSFEIYDEKKHWIAYRQFCESFLAPLLLQKYNHAAMNKLLIAYPNGIPLEICNRLLPAKAKWNLNVFLHIYLPSKLKNKKQETKTPDFSKQKMSNLLQGLKSFVENVSLKKDKTVWDDYYTDTILNKTYLEDKKKLVAIFLSKISFNSMLDLGANDGEFSLPFANSDKKIISVDIDENCIERLYLYCKKNKIKNIHTVINNLAFPSPAIGWRNEERENIHDRIKTDVTLVLALIHHLAIAENIPLKKIVDYFYSLSPFLIIEFVEKTDAKVQELLKFRKDIFEDYNTHHRQLYRLLLGQNNR
ncbi:MAG: class I SAM-dependent methyltransferase [Chitinophagaceae bacterium]|nr:class I SAM-dependent methyltransferase [Chitinophagaceae bacterium]